MTERISELVDGQTLLFAPVECDGHSDHEAVAVAAEAVAREREAALLQYPVWLWHWATPDDIDWSRVRTVAPSLRALIAKSAAIDCYTSQLASTDGFPIIGAGVYARARRVMETVLVRSRVSSRIGTRSWPYRRDRSRAQIAAPFDTSWTAVRQTRGVWTRRSTNNDELCSHSLAWAVGTIPMSWKSVVPLDKYPHNYVNALTLSSGWTSATRRSMWPAHEPTLSTGYSEPLRPTFLIQFDLIVLSEVTYFLDGPELLATLRAVRRRLRPHGEVLIANWSAPTKTSPWMGQWSTPRPPRSSTCRCGLAITTPTSQSRCGGNRCRSTTNVRTRHEASTPHGDYRAGLQRGRAHHCVPR